MDIGIYHIKWIRLSISEFRNLYRIHYPSMVVGHAVEG